jgi:hypothetical protein
MAVLLVVFNPCNSVRIVQNLLLVKQKLETAAIPCYIAELAFDDRSHIFGPSDTVFQYRSSSYLFYKENLINLAETRIPAEFSKICTLDADIIFAQADWYDRISTVLDTHDICHVFQQANWLDITFSKILKSNTTILKGQHPGFGWAVRRSFFRTCGFPEFAVVGGGDTVISGLDKQFYSKEIAIYNSKKPAGLRITYAPELEVFHLFHGSEQNRQYASRYDAIHTFITSIGKSSISDILFKREDGLFELIPECKESMNALMRAYFLRRSDDAV